MRMFYGSPSECLREDDAGTVIRIPQGEGGEQGDDAFCSVWVNTELSKQHNVSCMTEWFLDDINFATLPPPAYTDAQQELWIRAGIRVHVPRPRCGTWSASDQLCATSWRELLAWRTLGQLCGLVRTSHHTSKVSRFWGPHWATLILLPPICNEFQQSTRRFCSASPSVADIQSACCCFSIVLRPERVTN